MPLDPVLLQPKPPAAAPKTPPSRAARAAATRQQQQQQHQRLSVPLGTIFLIIVCTFSVLTFVFQGKYAASLLSHTSSVLENTLEESRAGSGSSGEAVQQQRLRQKKPSAGALGARKRKPPDDGGGFELAGLSCERYGGPSDELAREMVYWEDLPTDAKYVSPLKKDDRTEYLTFEPDTGGWNNIRMAMETVLGMAFAMGRTLVLPPEQEMYLLKTDKGKAGDKQRNQFSFNHFFHMEAIHNEHVGLDIITMEEFLEREAMAGNMVDEKTGKVSFPPHNRTAWDGRGVDEVKELFTWLRSVSHLGLWDPDKCLLVFPASQDHKDVTDIYAMRDEILKDPPNFEDYVGHPVDVAASTLERLKENWAARTEMCLYDEDMQAAQFVHFPVDRTAGARLLIHFYAFLFFQDWRQDLWMKRFVRDHVRYVDEIQVSLYV
jgi:hypothetical protein